MSLEYQTLSEGAPDGCALLAGLALLAEPAPELAGLAEASLLFEETHQHVPVTKSEQILLVDQASG